MTTISVIVPIISESGDVSVLSHLKDMDYPEDKIEVILTIGKCPPAQRNKAAGAAKGDVLYFFNRDSQPAPDIFKKTIDILNKNENIAGVGGSDLTPPNNNYLQHLFGYAMSSYFAHWKMRSRYASIGRDRFSDEKEFLLSNMAIKRGIFLNLNGFNKRLYPNEENELINRISKKGYKFLYSPDLKIYRDRRKNFLEFIKQFYRYGQGRMNQISIEKISKNLQFFLPVLLLFYVSSIFFINSAPFIFIPLFLYVILSIIDAAYLSFKHRKFLIIWLPILYFMMHVSYALGMISSLAMIFAKKRYAKKNCSEPKIKIIKFLGSEKKDYLKYG